MSRDQFNMILFAMLVEKVAHQVQLMLWKRLCEYQKQKFELLKVVIVPFLFFCLVILLYASFPGVFFSGGVEEYFIPIGMWIVIQKTVVSIVFEKNARLQEALRMMGLYDISYFMSYFISEGILMGFCISMICSLASLYGLFNHADFGTVLGMMFSYCLASASFSFFLCSFFDTPQTAGQATLLVLIGFYVVYLATNITYGSESSQIVCCFFPPLAFQIATGSFKKSYTGVPVSKICGIMIADVFIYFALTWYFSQVWPSSLGISKPWYFLVTKEYWYPSHAEAEIDKSLTASLSTPFGMELPSKSYSDMEKGGEIVPQETVNEEVWGRPKIAVNALRKSFDGMTVVRDISFNMYENQIFALLGHNGAGKTTTINMLTGLFRPDRTKDCKVTIYGNSLESDMDSIRRNMGVCPQHDVLFENLTVREHILLSAQLKGYTYADANKEAEMLTKLFHLEKRLEHTGSELSGGQKRKLSVAIAVCGGSKFVLLDEPTAGMDPLARRELWDLLTSLRKGRTMLLTTHYMDEADVLGDRVAIMNLGTIQCIGSTQFLKTTYGAGYKLVFDKLPTMNELQLAELTTFVTSHIPDAKYVFEDGSNHQALYNLPFASLPLFGPFFEKLESNLDKLHVTNFGVMITSLEDVFLKVGEDHSVTPVKTDLGIGSSTEYNSNFFSQVIGIAYRRLNFSLHDLVTIPLLGLPAIVGIVSAALYKSQVISNSNGTNDVITAALYMGGYLGAPGLLAEFIVKERVNKLRNVLTVMGCSFEAYWIGTLIADYLLMSVPMVIIFISWAFGGMSDFYSGKDGLVFFLMILFTFQLVCFSYISTYMFTSPKACIAFMPLFVIVLIIFPSIMTMLIFMIFSVGFHLFTLSAGEQAGIILWGLMILSPHGALYSALLDTTLDVSSFLSQYPPVGATIAFMIVESVVFLYLAYYLDSLAVSSLLPDIDPSFDESVLNSLDQDVVDERKRILEGSDVSMPLSVSRLRKVFPPTHYSQPPVTAVEDVCFGVEKGEIFGLLGANGAGKTTTLSMLTRHLVPTSGDARVANFSILSQFQKASTHLGVVTQTNSLWDLLSVEDHLYLFARLRGVPEDLVKTIVEGTIDQLELTPHRKKLAHRLSGGMKRKLCVAIALIGDPDVVLLDEPSAGLDPVSRRNLWSVILRTMSDRAVVLTTHSMEEAEALCKRIGIMVKGQMRALGTKQHLKVKFSSGYELSIKLKAGKLLINQIEKLTSFVLSMFPSSNVISENGGLVTYRIPKDEMKVSKAFTLLEKHRADMEIEDYCVTQPTLEQIFIRTVVDNSGDEFAKSTAGSTAIIGGSVRMTLEGFSSMNDVSADDPTLQDPVSEAKSGIKCCNLDDGDVNMCGCSTYSMRIMTMIATFLFFLFIIVSIAVGSSACFAIAVIALIVSIVGCILLFCPCCKKPKGMDE